MEGEAALPGAAMSCSARLTPRLLDGPACPAWPLPCGDRALKGDESGASREATRCCLPANGERKLSDGLESLRGRFTDEGRCLLAELEAMLLRKRTEPAAAAAAARRQRAPFRMSMPWLCPAAAASTQHGVSKAASRK